MIKLVRTLGTSAAGPKIYVRLRAIPRLPHTSLFLCLVSSRLVSSLSLSLSLPSEVCLLQTAIPPPLRSKGAYGMNQTVINSVYPKLVPMIAKANAPIDGVIDVFHGMGGEDNWAKDFPPQCTKQNSPTDKTDCALWCDDQSCDQCHPNNNGYVQMATIMKKGLGL